MQRTIRIAAFATALAMIAAGIGTASAYDPPGRVARMSYAEGEVSFAPAGEDQWLRVQLNRPQVAGDRLWTDARSRAELQLGGATLRMDAYSSVQILALDDRIAQVELTQGVVNLRVRSVYGEQSYEIATPTLAFVTSQPGDYRIAVDRDGQSTTVVVWQGDAAAYGEGGRFDLRDGDAFRFFEPTLRDYENLGYPRPDAFDRFVDARDAEMDRSASLQYVPDDLIGYSDLDRYGTWSQNRDYGAVWYPTRVNAGWAPYRDGRWIWQDPWGWTWVDDAPWGFAPYHYGRWAFVGQRWGWVPGSRRYRPVYAPALVAFVGGNDWAVGLTGGSRPVGWFPLGPRDVYVPAYGYSRDYFTRVNVYNTVINNTTVVNVYNDYARGQPRNRLDYMHRNSAYAITAVSDDVFTRGRPVNRSMLRVDAAGSARAQATHMAAFAPVAGSLAGSSTAASRRPDRSVSERRVIARSAPPPAPTSFDSRREALQRNPGQPQSYGAPAADRGRGRSSGAQSRVQVVGEPAREVDRSAGDRSRSRSAAGQAERYTYPQQVPDRGRQAQDPDAQRRIDESARDADRGRRAGEDSSRAQAEQFERQRGAQESQRAADDQRRGSNDAVRESDSRRQAEQFERQRQQQEQQQRQAEQTDRQRQQVDRQRQQQDEQQRQAEQTDRQRQQVDRQRQQQEEQQRQAEQTDRQRQQVDRQRQQQDEQQRQAERFERQRQQSQEQERQQQQRQSEQVERQRQQQDQQQRQAEQYERQRQQEDRQRQGQEEQRQRQAEQYERQRQQQEQQQEQQQRQQQEQQQEKEQEQSERENARGRGRSRDPDNNEDDRRR